ncbi:MAG: NADH-quinone oxidoreductase subunit L [Deltaproteobacteria bacterium]|nr:NADH-quinone oxidoreductase subunit L [Deltaproteobacteria bacterium]
MLNLMWIALLFPFLSAITNGFYGNRYSRQVVGLIACLGGFGPLMVSCRGWWDLVHAAPVDEWAREAVLWQWVPCDTISIDIGFLVDPLTLVLLLLVSSIAFLVQVYSLRYMERDEGFRRFCVELNLLIFFMLTLILANNFLLLFVGWQGLAFCTYLLIGFRRGDHDAAERSKTVFIVGRIADYGFLIALLLLAVIFGSLDFSSVLSAAPKLLPADGFAVTTITLLLFLGAAGKSAQIPLHIWLTDTRDAPLPAGALINTVTTVSAGVYLVLRFNVLYGMAPITLWVMAVTGVVTALYAAAIALTQFDIRKVLAYSSMSQFGLIFLACGTGAFAGGLYYLVIHAFAKTLLFLAAGGLMYSLEGEADMRRMGCSRVDLPWTHLCFVIGVFAIAGIGPFGGFLGLEPILWKAYGKNVWLWGGGVATLFLTVLYMLRALFLIFYGALRQRGRGGQSVKESPVLMIAVLAVLSVISIGVGWIGIPEALCGKDRFLWFVGSVFMGPRDFAGGGPLATVNVERFAGDALVNTELILAGIIIAVIAVGVGMAAFCYLLRPSLPGVISKRLGCLYRVFANEGYGTMIYRELFVEPVHQWSRWMARFIDEGVVEKSVVGMGRLIYALSAIGNRANSGSKEEDDT